MKPPTWVAALVLGGSLCAAPVCPINIPVVTLPSQTVAGFTWGPVIRPMGDPCVSSIAVDPANASEWYVGGVNGLYMTKDDGQTWTHPLNGPSLTLRLVPGNPLVYVGIGNKLYLSRDKGKNWNVIGTYPAPVSSILVVGYRLYVGLENSQPVPSGVYISNLGGGLAIFQPFGPAQNGLIVWTLAHDPVSGNVYAGTEIASHPQPYHPPFFRSTNGGLTWMNVAGSLPWHVLQALVRPSDGFVYAMTEGDGLFGSANQGNAWQQLTLAFKGPTNAILLDSNLPARIFGGQGKYDAFIGGVFLSTNAGQSFQPIGLAGVTVSALAEDGSGKHIYAVAYASGIYTAPIP